MLGPYYCWTLSKCAYKLFIMSNVLICVMQYIICVFRTRRTFATITWLALILTRSSHANRRNENSDRKFPKNILLRRVSGATFEPLPFFPRTNVIPSLSQFQDDILRGLPEPETVPVWVLPLAGGVHGISTR